MSATTNDLIEFYAHLPVWVASAGLSSEAALDTADELEALVGVVQSAGYPPKDVDGPDPSSFPPPSDRIAGASTQIHGLLSGLNDDGWKTEVSGSTIADHCANTRDQITDRSTTTN